MPHDTRDPVPVAAALVTAIQTMVARHFDAADAMVATVTQLHAGTTHNVIPDTATLTGTLAGTLRSLSRSSCEIA